MKNVNLIFKVFFLNFVLFSSSIVLAQNEIEGSVRGLQSVNITTDVAQEETISSEDREDEQPSGQPQDDSISVTTSTGCDPYGLFPKVDSNFRIFSLSCPSAGEVCTLTLDDSEARLDNNHENISWTSKTGANNPLEFGVKISSSSNSDLNKVHTLKLFPQNPTHYVLSEMYLDRISSCLKGIHYGVTKYLKIEYDGMDDRGYSNLCEITCSSFITDMK